MVNDVASAIVPTVALKQLLVSSLVLGEGGAKKLFAPQAEIARTLLYSFL